MRVATTSQIISIEPFTNYSCAVSAATKVGDGPPATINGTSDEDGEYIIHYSYCDITHDVAVQSLQDHLARSLLLLTTQNR